MFEHDEHVFELQKKLAEAISILKLVRDGDPAAAIFANRFLARLEVNESEPSFERE